MSNVTTLSSCDQFQFESSSPYQGLEEINSMQFTIVNDTKAEPGEVPLPSHLKTGTPCLSEASPATATEWKCEVCCQTGTYALSPISNFVPFSQATRTELAGLSLEVNTLCQSCAGLLERLDYHQTLAERIKRGLKTIALFSTSKAVSGVAVVCSLCGATLPDRASLSAHLSSHLQGGHLPCPACGRHLASWRSLRRHVLTAHRSAGSSALLSRCRRCPAAFRSSGQLAAHRLRHHGAPETARRRWCPLCRRRLAVTEPYRAHLRTHGEAGVAELRRSPRAAAAGGKGRLREGDWTGDRQPTDERNERIGDGDGADDGINDGVDTVEDDVREEDNVKEAENDTKDRGRDDVKSAQTATDAGFRCSLCAKEFKRKQSLERHIGAVHKPSENLKCDKCDKTFSIKFYWQKHVNRHRDKAEQCETCGRRFVNSRALSRHRCDGAAPAPAPAPEPCPVCRQSGAGCRCGGGGGGGGGGASLTERRQLACQTCGAVFATEASLAAHRRGHARRRSRPCRTCGASLPSEAALRKHNRAEHGKRSYQCSVCGKCFGWKNNLDIHARIHAGERPFQCDVCGHATRCAANLLLHKQRVHSAERPHACPTCHKTFKERYSLAIHVRSHTGERPYVCERCGAGFVTKGKLNSHMSKHSESRPHECPLCLKALKTAAILSRHCRRLHGVTSEAAAARAEQQRLAAGSLAAHLGYTGLQPPPLQQQPYHWTDAK